VSRYHGVGSVTRSETNWLMQFVNWGYAVSAQPQMLPLAGHILDQRGEMFVNCSKAVHNNISSLVSIVSP